MLPIELIRKTFPRIDVLKSHKREICRFIAFSTSISLPLAQTHTNLAINKPKLHWSEFNESFVQLCVSGNFVSGRVVDRRSTNYGGTNVVIRQ